MRRRQIAHEWQHELWRHGRSTREERERTEDAQATRGCKSDSASPCQPNHSSDMQYSFLSFQGHLRQRSRKENQVQHKRPPLQQISQRTQQRQSHRISCLRQRRDLRNLLIRDTKVGR